ncbi:MAG: hypothetical protein P8K82_04125, partial [Paracoccaceae bacterium]|nr:hypothetical protein [Paracoccaceae bacterium]
SCSALSGVIATRASPIKVSLGVPIFIGNLSANRFDLWSAVPFYLQPTRANVNAVNEYLWVGICHWGNFDVFFCAEFMSVRIKPLNGPRLNRLGL